MIFSCLTEMIRLGEDYHRDGAPASPHQVNGSYYEHKLITNNIVLHLLIKVLFARLLCSQVAFLSPFHILYFEGKAVKSSLHSGERG